MPESDIILAGLGDAFSPINFAFVILGVVVGQFVGDFLYSCSLRSQLQNLR